MPQASTQVLSGVIWREHFNCYTAKLGGWLSVGFSWSMDQTRDPGYKLVVGTITLKRRGKDPKESAALVVEAAKQLLRKALTELEAVCPTPPTAKS